MIPGYSKRKQVSTERVMASVGVLEKIAPQKKILESYSLSQKDGGN